LITQTAISLMLRKTRKRTLLPFLKKGKTKKL